MSSPLVLARSAAHRFDRSSTPKETALVQCDAIPCEMVPLVSTWENQTACRLRTTLRLEMHLQKVCWQLQHFHLKSCCFPGFSHARRFQERKKRKKKRKGAKRRRRALTSWCGTPFDFFLQRKDSLGMKIKQSSEMSLLVWLENEHRDSFLNLKHQKPRLKWRITTNN